jgi:hypothetical protein
MWPACRRDSSAEHLPGIPPHPGGPGPPHDPAALELREETVRLLHGSPTRQFLPDSRLKAVSASRRT